MAQAWGQGQKQTMSTYQKQLTDGVWYWVKYDGLGKTYTAPAMYRADAKAFYSVEFSGVPEKEVVVLRKA